MFELQDIRKSVSHFYFQIYHIASTISWSYSRKCKISILEKQKIIDWSRGTAINEKNLKHKIWYKENDYSNRLIEFMRY